MESVLKHPELQGFRRWFLLTKDAHGLYKQHGFKEIHDPEKFLEIWNPDVYKMQN
jgi:N-acetylglutamate synthase-like GNAT family acetyltransferase